MAGVFAGRSHQKREIRAADKVAVVPTMPKLNACWQELDSIEARRLQLWGERIIADIKQWRHRERRRREGVGA